AIAEGFVDDEIVGERGVHGRGLGDDGFRARLFEDGQLRGPIRAEALAIGADARLVHFGPRFEVIDDAREFALGGFTGLGGRLAGPGRIDTDEADAVRNDAAEIFGEIFFAAVEAADGHDDGNGPARVFGKA